MRFLRRRQGQAPHTNRAPSFSFNTSTRPETPQSAGSPAERGSLPQGGIEKLDKGLSALTCLLLAVGILMVYSASHLLSSRIYDGYSYRYLQIHIIACVIGLVGMYVVSYIPYRFYTQHATKILILAFIGLALVFVPQLSSSVQGAEGGRFNRWIRLGPLPVNFQPVEFAKIALVIHVATFLSRYPERVKSLLNGILPNMLVLGAAFGLVAAQPDFGSALLLAATVCIVLFVGGIRIAHALLLAGGGIGMLTVLIVRDAYRLQRFIDYIALWKSPDAANYQLGHSLAALGSGGFLGVGIDNSALKIVRLPYPHTDFIFSVLGEEFGFIGTATITLLFMLFVWRGLHIARHADDRFGGLLAIGMTTLIGLQAFINIGVVTGILPTKGITLPFISYGGSSIVLSLVSVGILLSVSRSSVNRSSVNRSSVNRNANG